MYYSCGISTWWVHLLFLFRSGFGGKVMCEDKLYVFQTQSSAKSASGKWQHTQQVKKSGQPKVAGIAQAARATRHSLHWNNWRDHVTNSNCGKVRSQCFWIYIYIHSTRTKVGEGGGGGLASLIQVCIKQHHALFFMFLKSSPINFTQWKWISYCFCVDQSLRLYSMPLALFGLMLWWYACM